MEVADIIDAVDMEEYISQFCDLEERGGELWGLSPFKDENTPSFSVNLEKKFWYDFSAGCGGNLLDFVMRYHNVSLIKAISILKKYANITDDDSKVAGRMQAARIASASAQITTEYRVLILKWQTHRLCPASLMK